MYVLTIVLIALVALLHLYFLYLEMFAWTKPAGLKAFRNTPEKAELTRVLAANQGLYNGFLAAGLIWSLLESRSFFAFDLKLFFLACVIIAALYGAYSVSRRILLIQGLPAIVALGLTVVFANPYLDLDCCSLPQVQATTNS
jgi:putative membrane protein